MGMGYGSFSGSGSGREDVASTLAAMTDPNSEPEFVFLTPRWVEYIWGLNVARTRKFCTCRQWSHFLLRVMYVTHLWNLGKETLWKTMVSLGRPISMHFGGKGEGIKHYTYPVELYYICGTQLQPHHGICIQWCLHKGYQDHRYVCHDCGLERIDGNSSCCSRRWFISACCLPDNGWNLVMKRTNCRDGDNVQCVVSNSLEFWRVILNTEANWIHMLWDML